MTKRNLQSISEKAPFFSIIITTYNRSALLLRAIKSLLIQIETSWEAIIIDDGSTDNTEQTIQLLIADKPQIRLIKNHHCGTVDSVNLALSFTTGKYITFLDSDDEYEPNHLSSRRSILEDHPLTEFLHGGVKIIGKQDVPDRFNPQKRIPLTECVIGGTFFIQSGLLKKVGLFKNIPLGSDADFFDRVQEAKAKIIKTTIPSYIYHHETQDSITNSFSN